MTTRILLAPIIALGLFLLPQAVDAKGLKASQLKGTWQLKSMTKAGKTEQMPAGMTITITFNKGNTYSLNMDMGGQKKSQPGKYWIKKGKLHITTKPGDDKKVEIITVRFGKKGTEMFMTKGDETVRAIRVVAKSKK